MKKAANTTTPTPWTRILGDIDLGPIVLETMCLKDRARLALSCLMVNAVVAPPIKETRDVIKEIGIDRMMVYAAVNNKLHAMIDAHREFGQFLNSTIASQAARYGNLDILRYIGKFSPEIVVESACSAARKGQTNCLRFALEVHNQNPGLFDDDDNHPLMWASYGACEDGQLECVKMLNESGIRPSEAGLQMAAFEGHIEVLKYALSIGCPKGKEDIEFAVARRQFETVQFLHTNGWPMDLYDGKLCAVAVSHYADEILEYLLAHGCVLTDRAMTEAVRFRKFELVVWLKQRGCPMSRETMRVACVKEDTRVVAYLLNNGCPYDLAAAIKKRTALLNYPDWAQPEIRCLEMVLAFAGHAF